MRKNTSRSRVYQQQACYFRRKCEASRKQLVDWAVGDISTATNVLAVPRHVWNLWRRKLIDIRRDAKR